MGPRGIRIILFIWFVRVFQKVYRLKRIWKVFAIVTISCLSVAVYVCRSYTYSEAADSISTEFHNVYILETSSTPSQPHNVYLLETSVTPSEFLNVYFVETSGRGTLSLRQLASVESAARHIPNSKVIVLVFSDGNYTLNDYMATLEDSYNITFKPTLKKHFIEGTPLEPWYLKRDWKKSPYVVSHTSDALRFLTLWKYGGIYLDLDVIFTNTWTVENNLVVAETATVISSGILAFTKKHPVLLNCIQWLCQNYKPQIWAANGPYLVTKMVTEYLSDKLHEDNITILSNSSFYEIYFTEFNKFFDPKYFDEVLRRTKSGIGVHLWNKLSAQTPFVKNSSCAYNYFLNRSSPIIYAAMLNA